MNPLPDLRPQIQFTAANAPLTTWLRKTPDEKARKRLRAAITVEAIGKGEIEWVDADGWRYQLEAPPRVTIAPKDNERAAATVDLKVWDASNALIFRDRIHAWDGFPVLVPDGTQHKETLPDGTTHRVDNFRESPVEAARLDLAHTVRVVTKNGPWVKANPGTVSTFYADTADSIISSVNASYATARAGGTISLFPTASGLNVTWQSGYTLRQSHVPFDTSALPDADDITGATLSYYHISSDLTNTDGWTTIRVRAYDYGASIGSEDWRPTDGTSATDTLVATMTYSSLSGDGYHDFTSEAALLTTISKTGLTKVYHFIANIEAATAPTGANSVNFSSADTAGTTQDPKLVVTHAAATPKTMLLLGIG